MIKTSLNHKPLYFSLGLRYLTQTAEYFYYILMPMLVIGLNSSPQELKLTVSIFFIGLALSLFFSGPLIDAIGTLKSFWIGGVIFLIGTVICYLSDDIHSMVIGRFIQAIAVGILQVLSKGLLASSNSRTTFFTIYHIVLVFAAPFAMVVTSLILLFSSWRASFIFLLIFCGLILGFGIYGADGKIEPGVSKKKFNNHLKTYWLLLREKGFLAQIISYGMIYSVLVPYYVTVTYIMVHTLNYQPHFIGLTAVIFAIGGIAGNYTSLILIKMNREEPLLFIGFLLSFIGAFSLLLAAFFLPTSFSALIIPMLILVFGTNLFYGKFNSYIIGSYERISKNITLSSMAISCALISSFSTFIASFHGHQNIQETALLIFFMTLASIALYFLSTRPNQSK